MRATTAERWLVSEMAISILFVLVALLAIGVFLLFGALAEAYRDIRQLREAAGITDQPTPVDLGKVRDATPSSLGLHPDLDSAVHAVVVYLESRCGTCRTILGTLNGGIPNGIWLVVIAESAAEASEWLAEAAIEGHSPAGRRVMISSAEEVERNLGVRLTPLAIEIENGRLVRARTIPSARQFYALVPTTFSLNREKQGALS